jgi:hypothetical protein
MWGDFYSLVGFVAAVLVEKICENRERWRFSTNLHSTFAYMVIGGLV